jgi:hypothetical protein
LLQFLTLLGEVNWVEIDFGKYFADANHLVKPEGTFTCDGGVSINRFGIQMRRE